QRVAPGARDPGPRLADREDEMAGTGTLDVRANLDRARAAPPLSPPVTDSPADLSLARTIAQHRRTRHLVLASPLVLGAVLLGVWEAVSRAGIVSAFFLPAPSAVATRLWTEVTEGGLLGYTAITLTEALLGSVAGAAIAFPLGYLIARNRWAAAGLQP